MHTENLTSTAAAGRNMSGISTISTSNSFTWKDNEHSLQRNFLSIYLIADVARRICRCLIEPLRKRLEIDQGSSEPIKEMIFDTPQIF
jgi:hypothetical protein